MKKNYYTHAFWHVKEGMTEEFIDAWKKFGLALSEVPNAPSLQGTLIQSLTDPLVFYSFGPWESLDDITMMKNNDKVKKAMLDIIEFCQKATPDNYKTVLELVYPAKRNQ